MKANTEINKKVKATLDSAESIGKVEVSPFFKERLMQQIRNSSEEVEAEEVTWFTWFTPKLQLATLVCVVVMNIAAFQSLKESDYTENLTNFAETYGLSTSAETTLIK